MATSAAAQEWSRIDPENVIVIDTSKGRLVIEARPEIAPQAVARVKRLAREGVYDGLQIHRVVEHFVAQTGNPNNRDGGASAYPNLPPEFVFRLKPGDATLLAVKSSDGVAGFLGSVPFAGAAMTEADRASDGTLRAWGAYCSGVAGMGRQAGRDTANSEIFFMLEAARRLDRDYTAWGRIVNGMPVLRSLYVGSPPPTPDLMRRVRVLAVPTARSRDTAPRARSSRAPRPHP
jgi:peptidylprolyl isomerase